jgi:putative restriction endonuclease
LLAKTKNITIEELYENEVVDIEEKGIEKQRLVKTRVNQYRFRKLVLSNYTETCCITGIRQPDLLIASHITSWSKYENNRLNPMNGLCLNALHDRAFDKGLITVMADNYTIKVSTKLRSKDRDSISEDYFLKYDGKQ